METLTGVNTLNLSASTTPLPDIVALAASNDPGYVDIPGATGTGNFAAATFNLGVAASITASANTGPPTCRSASGCARPIRQPAPALPPRRPP